AARDHATASEHQGVSLMGLGKRGRLPRSTSPRSLDELAQLRTHTAHYSPVTIAPLSINSSHGDCALFSHFDWAASQSGSWDAPLSKSSRGNVTRRRSVHAGCFNAAVSTGGFRKRLAVAAKIALNTAGTMAEVPASPIPPGGSEL